MSEAWKAEMRELREICRNHTEQIERIEATGSLEKCSDTVSRGVLELAPFVWTRLEGSSQEVIFIPVSAQEAAETKLPIETLVTPNAKCAFKFDKAMVEVVQGLSSPASSSLPLLRIPFIF